MVESSIRIEFLEFIEFATTRISGGENAGSVEELLHQWRKEREYAAVVGDVRQGMLDIAAGKGDSIKEVISSIRRRLGVSA